MPKRVPRELCVRCKGAKRLCGLERCPILERLESQRVIYRVAAARRVEGGTPPSVLVGEWSYPRIRVAPLILPDARDASTAERPGEWVRWKLSDIIRIRSRMLAASLRVNAKRIDERVLEPVQLAAMSEISVPLEARLIKPPRPRLSFDGILAPTGPSAEAERVDLEAEPEVPKPVERAVSDSDAEAAEVLVELYKSGIDVYHSTRLLSLALLGERGRRRLVPTRWAITAVDSILGSNLKKTVLGMPEYSGRPRLHRASFSDNRYWILILPGAYRLEVVEAWMPGSVWAGGEAHVVTNYEGAIDRGFPVMDGGHYAMRLPILEHLAFRLKRQASVLAVREIGPGYYAPVGSWQIRESIRLALSGPHDEFESVEEAVSKLLSELRVDLRKVIGESRLLREVLRQARIDRFLE